MSKHDPRVVDLGALMRALYNKDFTPIQSRMILDAARQVINGWPKQAPPDTRIHKVKMPSSARH